MLPLVTGFSKSFVYFTLHFLFRVCLFSLLSSMVQQYLLYLFPDIPPCPQHQLITIIHSSPAYANSLSVLIEYIIHISAVRLSIFCSCTLPCCFGLGAVLICHLGGNSHICILLYIFHTPQPCSSVFHFKIQPLITSLFTMHSFVTESLLEQPLEVIYLFLVKVTDIHNIAGNRNYPCFDCLDKVFS